MRLIDENAGRAGKCGSGVGWAQIRIRLGEIPTRAAAHGESGGCPFLIARFSR